MGSLTAVNLPSLSHLLSVSVLFPKITATYEIE